MKQLAAIIAALVAVGMSLAQPVPARAGEGLILNSHTTWDVRPEEGRIVVSIDMAATNVVPDTAAGRTYFSGIGIPIPAGATGVSAFGGGVGLAVGVSTLDELTNIADITFSTGVFYQQTYRFRLSFVITDGGGDPTRETWVRTSFVAFAAWPMGSDGNATLEVILPPGYEATDHLDALEVVADANATRMQASNLDPNTFWTYVTAERESDRVATALEIPFAAGDGSVVLYAWPDDPEWATRLGGWLRDGFPILEAEIGLPFPITDELRVDEHAYDHLGDYAGYYQPTLDTIAVRFDADAFTTLHEAAHVWFDRNLTVERWVTEGFASYYAEAAGTRLGLALEVNELTDENRALAFALTDWGDAYAEDLEREDYGYAASLAAARDIAALAGPEGLRAVWRATFDERRAYALGNDELLEDGEMRVREWQRMLDLFEIETGEDFLPIWTTWVIGEDDAAVLEERADARAAYGSTMTALDGWTMPEDTRLSMEWWDFDDAMEDLDGIGEVIAARAELASTAAGLDLEPTSDLRTTFETDGFVAAAAEADEQREALAAIGEAEEVVGVRLSALEQIGLMGEVPPADHVADARDAYENGEDADAVERAAEARSARDAAENRGRLRVGIAGGSVLALDLLAMGVLFAVRRRRRRSPLAT